MQCISETAGFLKALFALPFFCFLGGAGKRTRLPPVWPGFDSQTQRHMWVEFVGSLLCTERFSPGTAVSPLFKNQHLTWFAFIINFSLQCHHLVLQH